MELNPEGIKGFPAFRYDITNRNQGVLMVGRYKVITLCGSTRFKDEFMEIQKRLTLEGSIVISVGLFANVKHFFTSLGKKIFTL